MGLLYLLLPEHADRLRFIRRSAQPLGRFKSQYRHHADSCIYHDIFHHRPSSRPRLFCRFGYEYRQLCRCHGGCGRSIAGCGRRKSDGAFFEKDIKHLLQNRIKQGRLKQVSDGLMWNGQPKDRPPNSLSAGFCCTEISLVAVCCRSCSILSCTLALKASTTSRFSAKTCLAKEPSLSLSKP